jgi:hypothetical protein
MMNYPECNGNINIFFGKVVDVTDPDKVWRVKVSVAAMTDEIPVDLLPWYYPWNGLEYIPVKDDVVPVMVFNNNLSTCFYGRKVGLSSSSISDGDYDTYLEVYKRGDVSLTYVKSKGIEFSNKDGKVQVEVDKLSLFVANNSIVMTKDRIDIGDEASEASLLGDKSVKQMQDMLKHDSNITNKFITLFTAIASAATPNPFTASIGAVITSMMPDIISALSQENTMVVEASKKIQSKKVYIE